MLKRKDWFSEKQFEPFDRMQREFILRVLQNSNKVRLKDIIGNGWVEIIFGRKKIDDYSCSQQLIFPATKVKDDYLAQKERELCSIVYNQGIKDWEFIEKCCTYNTKHDLAPLIKYKEMDIVLKIPMRRLRSFCLQESLYTVLNVPDIYAFRFTFFDFPEPIFRRCQLLSAGLIDMFYECMMIFQSDEELFSKVEEKLYLAEDDSLGELIAEWKKYKTEQYSWKWFQEFGVAPQNEEEILEYQDGKTLGKVVIISLLSGYNIEMSASDIMNLLECSVDDLLIYKVATTGIKANSSRTLSIYENHWSMI